MSNFFKLGSRFLSGSDEYILAAAGPNEDSGVRLTIINLTSGKSIGTTRADKDEDEDGKIGLSLEHLKERYRLFNLIDKETNKNIVDPPLDYSSVFFNKNNIEHWIINIAEHNFLESEYRILNTKARIVYASGSWKKMPTLDDVREIYPSMRLKV